MPNIYTHLERPLADEEVVVHALDLRQQEQIPDQLQPRRRRRRRRPGRRGLGRLASSAASPPALEQEAQHLRDHGRGLHAQRRRLLVGLDGQGGHPEGLRRQRRQLGALGPAARGVRLRLRAVASGPVPGAVRQEEEAERGLPGGRVTQDLGPVRGAAAEGQQHLEGGRGGAALELGRGAQGRGVEQAEELAGEPAAGERREVLARARPAEERVHGQVHDVLVVALVALEDEEELVGRQLDVVRVERRDVLLHQLQDAVREEPRDGVAQQNVDAQLVGVAHADGAAADGALAVPARQHPFQRPLREGVPAHQRHL